MQKGITRFNFRCLLKNLSEPKMNLMGKIFEQRYFHDGSKKMVSHSLFVKSDKNLFKEYACNKQP